MIPQQCLLRLLLKFAHRMVTLHSPLLTRAQLLPPPSSTTHPHAAAQQKQQIQNNVAIREAAFIEMADIVYASSLMKDAATEKHLQSLAASVWAVPPSTVDQYTHLAKPSIHLQNNNAMLTVGRVHIPTLPSGIAIPSISSSRFAQTGHAMRHMERVAAALANNEPVLLVGETGTGKTTLVQQIAAQVNAKLVVVNLSQQTDSSDLIGGFRPLAPADAVNALLPAFIELVRRTWRRGNNEEFLDRVVKLATKRKWKQLIKAFRLGIDKALVASGGDVGGGNDTNDGDDARMPTSGKNDDHPTSATTTTTTLPASPPPSSPIQTKNANKKNKKKRITPSTTQPTTATVHHHQQKQKQKQPDSGWQAFQQQLVDVTAAATQSQYQFAFQEGSLIQAVREGWWLLLDEINLAPAEALERIAGLLDNGSITIAERGDTEALTRHPNFRMFAAMNPATDAGKRDLPAPLRSRFTEIWVGEPRNRDDLAAIVAGHLLPVSMGAPVQEVVEFYLAVKEAADTTLQDGAGHKPTYNLRTLSRALEYAARASAVYGLQRSLYDGFAMSFLTQLDPNSAATMEALMQKHLVGKGTSIKALMQSAPTPPSEGCVLFDHYWVEVGDVPVVESREDDGKGGVFVATPTVTQHLRNLARAVLLRKYPILLQGPTSSGKTSLVAYLAAQTGHHFVRINNHEQTDLQEYLGTYISDEQGQLVFQEGLLVQAVRNGHWIVLDELNLAPTEVLEALNRLLDDNRELFVPELQEVVKPHPHFMLFATQNPPGLYAGRKTLSRAFRSRFLELHVDDIPDDELHVILEKRCSIAPSYAAKLISVMRELQRRRALSNVFAGRHGFITPRDLFRWAGRGAIGYQQLAQDGFAVLGERLRTEDERQTVAEVLEKLLKTKIDMQTLYDAVAMPQMTDEEAAASGVGRLVWTKTFRRMYWLLERCLATAEPCLLVGETGLGKTSVCQLAAFARGQTLRIINCNQHTETSDFLGGYRPNRSRDKALAGFREALEAYNHIANQVDVASLPAPASSSFADLQTTVNAAKEGAANQPAKSLSDLAKAMDKHLATYRAPFEWVDGPLVLAMKEGDIILIDELNLAEDAVLERLNSALESSRTLTLAEKGGKTAEVVVAHPDFRIIATMNPGGDYGKKELSPALSNRFSTVWVPAMEDEGELRSILDARLKDSSLRTALTPLLLGFWAFYRAEIAPVARQVLSVRDLLTWIEFINSTASVLHSFVAYVHGAHVAFLDGIGLGVGLSEDASISLRARCIRFLVSQVPSEEREAVEVALSLRDTVPSVVEMDGQWGLSPFFLPKVADSSLGGAPFNFDAPTTAKNAFRLLRAMQLRKPILLEGSPGVGKTSLVAALSKAIGRKFVRINLSEQTDMMDLLGADLPVEGGGPGEFAWSDGPLLQAIKSGAWVLLDELNLANQTVLEGLNALLDHRAEVFIPELNATFKCVGGFRIFGAQNPLQEGGGRKGLPKSFLNRFSRVHVELLQRSDLLFIASVLYPAVGTHLIDRMVDFLNVLHTDARDLRIFASVGGPWEFNLRDLLRWCELIAAGDDATKEGEMEQVARHYAGMLFVRRMRSVEDRSHVSKALDKYLPALSPSECRIDVTPTTFAVGQARISRSNMSDASLLYSFALLPGANSLLEAVATCISMKWMCLLVGPGGTGKTAVIRTIAQLCGKDLLELPLNSGTDTSDLLGGFEQVDLVRKRSHLAAAIDGVLAQLLASTLASMFGSSVQFVTGIIQQWSDVKAGNDLPLAFAETGIVVLDSIEAIAKDVPDGSDRAQILERLNSALALAKSIVAAGDEMDGRFEWVDGSLTKAISEGRWVVLDNANLCNPSVLDRLNPLLEPHGVLYLNECGTGADGPRVIYPHPDFRLFLTFDPKHGEVSRAMRNRGLELFLLPDRLSGLSGEEDVMEPSATVRDLQVFAGLQGLARPSHTKLMAKMHEEMREVAFAGHRRPPSLRELVRWASMLRSLTGRGLPVDTSMRKSFETIYVHPFPLEHPFADNDDEIIFQPGVWPLPLSAEAFAANSTVSNAVRDVSVVLHWVGRLELPLASSYLNLLIDSSLVTCAFVPGDVLTPVLLGGHSVDDGVVLEDETVPSEKRTRRKRAAAALDAAIQVFMERGAASEFHKLFVSKYLMQCASATGGAPAVEGAGKTLYEYFSDCAVSIDNMSPKLALLQRSISMAVFFQHIFSSNNGPIPHGTLLEISCWRYRHYEVRNRFEVPHKSLDWIWTVLAAIQGVESDILGAQPSTEVPWTEDLHAKVRTIATLT